VTARHWTSRHRDDLLTRVTVLTAGTAVLGAVGATGLGVGMLATTVPKTTAVGQATPTDAAPVDTGAPARAASPTAPGASATTTKSRATTTTTKAAARTTVKATPVATKKASTPPPAPPQPKPKPTAASGGS
jgi:hypothetical protein